MKRKHRKLCETSKRKQHGSEINKTNGTETKRNYQNNEPISFVQSTETDAKHFLFGLISHRNKIFF